MKESDQFGWRFEEVISPHSGKVRRNYFFRGRKAYRVPLDSHVAKQLAGWSLIEKDLRNLLSWASILESIIEEICGKNFRPKKSIRRQGTQDQAATMKALMISILSFYGKLFTQAKGRRVVLQKAHVSENFCELHETLMEMRHSYAAHAGEEGHEEAIMVVALDSNRHRMTPYRVYTELYQVNNFLSNSLEELTSLINELQDLAKSKMKLLHVKLDQEIAARGSSIYPKSKREKRKNKRVDGGL